MRRLISGLLAVGLALSLEACPKAQTNDAADAGASANEAVPVETMAAENAAIDNSAAENLGAADDAVANNATDQGSTDH